MMLPDLTLRGRSGGFTRGADALATRSHLPHRLPDFLREFKAKHLDAAIQGLRLSAAAPAGYGRHPRMS
jgi:hypothetical protein